MKKLLFLFICLFCVTICFGQKHLLSYDDLKFILIYNLQRTDTFMMANGYTLKTKNNRTGNRTYRSVSGDLHIDVDVRQDGKRLMIEIETNLLSQYDLIHNSIAKYLNKESTTADVQTYAVKDLGTIFITVNVTTPYDPLKREYDIHVVPDKRITAYN